MRNVLCNRRTWIGAAALAVSLLPAATPARDGGAPDFTLKSLQGPNLKLSEHRGRVVLLNFWATWCGPCRQEMPELNKLHEKYRATGLQVLGVNVDDRSSNAKSMAGRLGVRFPVLLDTEKKVSRLYDIRVMPTTVLIDRDGRVRHTHHGYKPGYEATYEKQVRELLKDGAG